MAPIYLTHSPHMPLIRQVCAWEAVTVQGGPRPGGRICSTLTAVPDASPPAAAETATTPTSTAAAAAVLHGGYAVALGATGAPTQVCPPGPSLSLFGSLPHPPLVSLPPSLGSLTHSYLSAAQRFYDDVWVLHITDVRLTANLAGRGVAVLWTQVRTFCCTI
jgi:hypothetical protein